MKKYVVGLDIGGTRIKIGIVELGSGHVLASKVFATERRNEDLFYENIFSSVRFLLQKLSIEASELDGVGVSIGSYVYYPDGTLDGMSSFVEFMTFGYPLKEKIEKALKLPVLIDNDARLIGQAEALYGAGRDFERVLTLTLGTGVGVGLCIEGKPVGKEAVYHMAGHIRVRDRHECEWLDEKACYCGIYGCFEGTCSGTALESYVHRYIGNEMSNEAMFEMARLKMPTAVDCANLYIEMLCRGLNQYVYIFCPDVIVLGGGISNSLELLLPKIWSKLTAKVNEKRKTEICLAELKEFGGILGSAALFLL